MKRVLIVDDDPRMSKVLGINLRARHYQVTTAPDGGTALRLAPRTPPDVVILDLGLPDLPGTDVILGLRAWTSLPIVVLSGRTDSADKIAALDAGADDYLTKPFLLEELLARLRAVLRRPAVIEPAAPVDVGDFRIDPGAYTIVRRDGQGDAPHLTPNEWRLLAPLLRNPGRTVTGRHLLREVWGPGHEDNGNYLRVYFASLRGKLEPDRGHPRHIVTESGIGYRFEP